MHRILITNLDDQPQFIGGIKRVSALLAEQWRKEGHEVCFLTHSTSTLRFPEIAGIPNLLLPKSDSIDNPENETHILSLIRNRGFDILINQFADDADMVSLCAKIREQSPDVRLVTALHFAVNHTTSIIDASFFTRLKLGSKIKRYAFDVLRYVKYQLLDKRCILQKEADQYRQVYDSSDLTVLLSEKFIPEFAKKISLPVNQCTKLTAINNPIVSIYEENRKPKEKLVVWCGRNEYGPKRLDRMLSIWKRFSQWHPDWHCAVLGGGDIAYWKQLADSMHLLNIEFVGFCNPSEWYARASMLCMTSASEGWGMVLVEAQAQGCIPMAYHTFHSLTDIITDGENGFIIPAVDEKEYVRKMHRLATDDSLREKMACNAQTSVNRFDAMRTAKKWTESFNII